ncbi:MAG: hypothetical protein ACM3SY_03605 [Candidatus Omnitrophota bacterium]
MGSPETFFQKGFWPPEAAINGKRHLIFFYIAILIALNLLLYIHTIHYEFLKDDFRLIVENPRIQDFKTFTHTLGSKFFSFPDYPYLHYWRPMALFSFYLDYQLWGLHPLGYHGVNVTINALNAFLVFLIFYLVFKRIHYAFLTALLFSIHPAHVEAVSWVSGRTDLLGAFFIFSAVLFFILFLNQKKNQKKIGLYLASAFAFILGLLSKENAVLFPLMAIGLIGVIFSGSEQKERPPIKRILCFYVLPLWIIDGLYLFFHNRFSGVGHVVSGFSFHDLVPIVKTIGVYTKVILFPFFPTYHFSMHGFDHGALEFYLYFIGFAVILALLSIKRTTYTGSLLALLFCLFLLPVLDPVIVPSYPKIVIRFAYIASVFAGVFFLDTVRLFKANGLRTLFVVMLIASSGLWAMESVVFQGYFKNKYQHYEGLIPYHPNDCSLLLPFALIKAQDGDYTEALGLADRVLTINRNDPWLDVSDMAGLLKANLLVITNHTEQGKTLAERILGETQKKEMKYYGAMILAKYHEKTKDYAMALRMLERAEKIGETADLYFRKALVYIRMGKPGDALGALRKARELDPFNAQYGKLDRLLSGRSYRNP